MTTGSSLASASTNAPSNLATHGAGVIPAPILALEGVFARDSSGPAGASRGSIADLWLRLGIGAHGVLGAPEDGTLAFVEAVTGATKVTRGRVLVGSLDPRRHDLARRRVAGVSLSPALPIAKTVRESVLCAIAGRRLHSVSSEPAPQAVLHAFGLSQLADRSLGSLSWEERRSVDIAIALSLAADLYVLFEPLSANGPIDEAALVLQVEALSKTACVLVVSSSPGDLRRLAKSALVFHRGLLVRAEGGTLDGLASLSRTDLFVTVSSRARALVSALGDDPRVVSVSLELASDGEGGFVRFGGRDPIALGAALAQCTRQTGAQVLSVNELPPSLAEVRQQTEWLMYASYVAASRAAQAQGQGGSTHHTDSATAALPAAMPVSHDPLGARETEADVDRAVAVSAQTEKDDHER